jgi:hypothetical protein
MPTGISPMEDQQRRHQQRLGASRMIDRQNERVMRRAHVVETADLEHLLARQKRQAADHPGIKRVVLRWQRPAQKLSESRRLPTSSLAVGDIGSAAGWDQPLHQHGQRASRREPHRRFALQNDEIFTTV